MPPKIAQVARGEWECMECGYIEKGLETQRPAQCRECGASARALEFFADDDWDEIGAEEDDALIADEAQDGW
jgi:hypothetical protein